MASPAHAHNQQVHTCLHKSASGLRPRSFPREARWASQRNFRQPCRPCRDAQLTVRAVQDSRQHRCNQNISRQLLGLTAAGITSFAAGSALATSKVGEFSASGFIFKDSVEAVSVEDPDVKGVTIYISDFHRSLSDKLNKDFFSEPSQIKDFKAISGPEGHEVFSERKGLSLFQNKTLRVRRLYDDKNNTLLYVAYSTRLDGSKNTTGSRYKTSICALPVAPAVSPAASAPSAAYPDAMK